MTALEESNSGEKDKLLSSSSEQLYRRFSLAEIQSATLNFDDALVIGQGGFGKVYKGFLGDNVSTVAIKRLNSMSEQGAPEYWTEIEMLSKFRHCHLVSLIGYCDDDHEMIIVYEYIPNGTLADHLHKIGRNDDSPLSWVQRLKICIGSARGLDYLHTGTSVQHRVIHRDVKSSNILLDESWAAKISDFGLSKIGPVNQSFTYVNTNVKGTIGYMDPEYFSTGILTTKSDVYAFGVVLFEVLCGKPAVDITLDEEKRSLAGWVQQCIKRGNIHQIIDPSLRGQILPKCLMKFTQVAHQCLYNCSKQRPTMAEIVFRLECALELQKSMDYSIKLVTGTFTTRVRQYFLGTTGLTTVHSDAKSPRNRKSKDGGVVQEVTPKDGGVLPEVQIVAPNLRVFTFDELRSATDNFGEDMVVGEGVFGMVFKGWVNKETYAPSKVGVGIAVAVKKFNPDCLRGLKVGQMVEFLGNSSHSNLVKLLGYYFEEDVNFFLVHEFMQNGSLESHLFRRGAKALPWVTRIKIAIGAARGLAFLHTTEKRVMYSNYKSSNILLDADFNAKLSDFGLAKLDLVNDQHSIDPLFYHPYSIRSRSIYMDLYDYTGLDVKSDVYGFGVVLLEILTGLRALDSDRRIGEQGLLDWAEPFLCDKRKLNRIMDRRIKGEYSLKEALQAAALTIKCLQYDARLRPSMVEVLETLEQINATENETR